MSEEVTRAFIKKWVREMELMGGTPSRRVHPFQTKVQADAAARRQQAQWECEEAARELYRRRMVRWRQVTTAFVLALLSLPVLALLFIGIAALWQGAFR